MNRLNDPITPQTPTSVQDDWFTWKQKNEHEKEAVARPSYPILKMRGSVWLKISWLCPDLFF